MGNPPTKWASYDLALERACRQQWAPVGHRAPHGEAPGLPPSGVGVGCREAGRAHPPVQASACALLGHALVSKNSKHA